MEEKRLTCSLGNWLEFVPHLLEVLGSFGKAGEYLLDDKEIPTFEVKAYAEPAGISEAAARRLYDEYLYQRGTTASEKREFDKTKGKLFSFLASCPDPMMKAEMKMNRAYYEKICKEQDFKSYFKLMRDTAYSGGRGQHGIVLANRLVGMKQADFKTYAHFISAFINLFDELEAAKNPISDDFKCIYLIRAVDQAQFSVPINNWNLTNPRPKFDDLVKSINDWYQQNKLLESGSGGQSTAVDKKLEYGEVKANVAVVDTEPKADKEKESKHEANKHGKKKKWSKKKPEAAAKGEARSDESDTESADSSPLCTEARCKYKGKRHAKGQHKWMPKCQACGEVGHDCMSCDKFTVTETVSKKRAAGSTIRSQFAMLSMDDDYSDPEEEVYMHRFSVNPSAWFQPHDVVAAPPAQGNLLALDPSEIKRVLEQRDDLKRVEDMDEQDLDELDLDMDEQVDEQDLDMDSEDVSGK